MPPEVSPNFKPPIGQCPCPDLRCNVEARPLTKKNKDGKYHNRGCTCASCRGRRNRKSGLAAQTRAAKALGVRAVNGIRPSNEEQFDGGVRIEVKSGAQVRPAFTAYLKAEEQSEATRSLGDARPFIMAARLNPSGKDGLIIFRESKLREIVYALAENLSLLDSETYPT